VPGGGDGRLHRPSPAQGDGAIAAAHRPPPDAPIIDVELATSRIGGASEVAEVARILIDECSALLREIHDARLAHEAERLRRAAHTLKSSADVFGAKAVVAAALRVEQCGKDADFAGAERAAAELEREVERLIPALGEVVGAGSESAGRR
jgi:HPt (histidine-containing phosphotransfer) domain-containing protein